MTRLAYLADAALLALGWLLLAVIVGVAAWVGFNQ
jgi:hypothetical protein